MVKQLDRLALWWLIRRRRAAILNTTFHGGIHIASPTTDCVVTGNRIITNG